MRGRADSMTGLSNRLGPSPDRPRNSGRRGSLSSVHPGPRLADPDKFSGVSASQNHPRLCPSLPVKQQSRLVLSLHNDPVFSHYKLLQIATGPIFFSRWPDRTPANSSKCIFHLAVHTTTEFTATASLTRCVPQHDPRIHQNPES